MTPGELISHIEAGRLSQATLGRLADVLPTALTLLGIEQPEEVTGQSLLKLSAAKA